MERIAAVELGLGYAALLFVYQTTMESDKSISTPSDGLNEGVQRTRPLHG